MPSVTRDVWLWLYGIERHSVNDLVRLLLGKLFRARALERPETRAPGPARERPLTCARDTHTRYVRHRHVRQMKWWHPGRSGKVTDSKSIKVKPAPRTALELTAELDTQRKDSIQSTPTRVERSHPGAERLTTSHHSAGPSTRREKEECVCGCCAAVWLCCWVAVAVLRLCCSLATRATSRAQGAR